MSARQRTALVLAGGGSYGAVQVGMLRALCAGGVQADLVAGASVGAINGAFYAGAPDSDGVNRLAALWRGLKRRDVFPMTVPRLVRALFKADHLFEPSGLRRLLAAHLPFQNLEDSVIPMHVVATDQLTAMPVRLSEGPAVEAILASCAIPAIYPPVRIGDRQLIDGAVAGNTPIRTAVELGAERLILLPTAFACPHAAPPRGVFANAFHAMHLVVMQQLAQDTELYARHVQIVTVPPMCPLVVAPYDFVHADLLIDGAARSTERWLEQGGLEQGETLSGLQERAAAADGCGPHAPVEPLEACGALLPSCIVS